MLRALILPAALLAAAGVAAITIPLTRFPVAHQPALAPAEVAVVARQVDLSHATRVRLEWDSGTAVRSALPGLVTAVAIEPGAQAACSDHLFSVEDRPVIAFCGAQPLWRPISAGMSGSDVAALGEYLTAVGVAQPGAIDDSAAFTAAVAAFREQHQLPAGNTLGPGELAWIGPNAALIEAVSIEVGAMVAPSEVVARVMPQLRSARADSAPSAAVGRRFELTLEDAGGVDVSVAVAPDGTIADLDAVAAAAIGRASGAPPVELEGRLRLVEPFNAWAVPASAVTSTSTTTCVRLNTGEIVAVEVVDFLAGTALVTGDLEHGSIIVADGGQRRCS